MRNWFYRIKGGSAERERSRLKQRWWETAAELTPSPDSYFDPLGSYTGRPAEGEEPEQDADDL